MGTNNGLQALEWESVVQQRASREPIRKGDRIIFYTWFGGFGSMAFNSVIRGKGTAARFDAPDSTACNKICEAIQVAFW